MRTLMCSISPSDYKLLRRAGYPAHVAFRLLQGEQVAIQRHGWVREGAPNWALKYGLPLVRAAQCAQALLATRTLGGRMGDRFSIVHGMRAVHENMSREEVARLLNGN